MSHGNMDTTGLRCIKTNAQFGHIIRDADNFPNETDGRHLCQRLYDNKRLNWCRPLDHCLVIRAVSRNYGYNTVSGGAGHVELGLPKPSDMFNVVWRLIPEYSQHRIKELSRKKMDGAIAAEIAEYVRQGLRLLPLPVPSFYVNSVTNLTIPPLVSFIISQFGDFNMNELEAVGLGSGAAEFRLAVPHNPKTLEILKGLDREILLASGLPNSCLPEHLMEHGDSDKGISEHHIPQQPDNRDVRVDITQFYEDSPQNGCKPLQLLHIISAQIRTNHKCDEDVQSFGSKVWGIIDEAGKGKLRRFAQERPHPNRKAIADTLYTPCQSILKREPYMVPGPILDSLNSMKVPEVTEWVIKTQGK